MIESFKKVLKCYIMIIYLFINVFNVVNLLVIYINMVRKLRCCCLSNEWDK